MATDLRTPLRLVGVAAGIAGAGAAWYAAHAVVGAGADGPAYVFLPAGTGVASFAVYRLQRAVRLDRVAGRFWRGLLIAFVLVTAGYAWFAATCSPDRPTWRPGPCRSPSRCASGSA